MVRGVRRTVIGRAGLVSLLLAVAVGVTPAAGIGTDGVAAEPVPWTRQVLGPPPRGDESMVSSASGGDVVLVRTTADGRLRGYRSSDGGAFRAGPPLAIGTPYFTLGGVTRWHGAWWAIGSGGSTVVRGDTQLRFQISVYRSVDGLRWAPVATTVERMPADVSGLVGTSSGLVAVGSLRTGRNPSFGPFRPVAWRSTDAKTWRRSGFPFTGKESAVRSVVATRSRLLAFGNEDGRSAMWSSTDGGHLWRRAKAVGLDEGVGLDEAAVLDDGTVVAQSRAIDGGQDTPDAVFARSTDGGATWTKVSSPPQTPDVIFAGQLTAGGRRVFTTMASFPLFGASACYADIERCRRGGEVALYMSEDAGHTWQRTDLSGVAMSGRAQPQQMIAGRDRAWIVIPEAEGEALFGRSGATPWPTMPEPEVPTFAGPFLAQGETPRQGVRYAVPLYIHCGMDWLYVGGTAWRRTDRGAGVETGAGQQPPAHWPVAGQTIYGFATLVAPDRIEYSIGDGEVIATYGRTDQPPPGCL